MYFSFEDDDFLKVVNDNDDTWRKYSYYEPPKTEEYVLTFYEESDILDVLFG